jgi:hypothetical protein
LLKKKKTEVKYKTPRFAPDYRNQSLCLSSSHRDTQINKQKDPEKEERGVGYQITPITKKYKVNIDHFVSFLSY